MCKAGPEVSPGASAPANPLIRACTMTGLNWGLREPGSRTPCQCCWLFWVPRTRQALRTVARWARSPAGGRATAPYGDGGGTCWCAQCSDCSGASVEGQETPKWPGREAVVGRGPAWRPCPTDALQSLLKPVLPEHRVGLAAFSLEKQGAEKQKTPAVERTFGWASESDNKLDSWRK